MWCVRTASRLHFGLLSLAADGDRWPDRAGRLTFAARRFGGVGLMVDRPGIVLRVEPAAEWSATGPLAARALEFAHSVVNSVAERLPPRHLTIESAPQEHQGLGTGTQLGLAVSRSLLASWEKTEDAPAMAQRVQRGVRSSLGVHGFALGGFLVEAGKTSEDLSPLIARLDFPADWRIMLLLPEDAPGRHGPAERAAFERLSAPVAETDALCRLVLLGLLPALQAHDFAGFSDAVFDFNARVGALFAPVQGGVYASPRVAELVAILRARGVRGVGQSSWGPGVFAVFPTAAAAERLRADLAPETSATMLICRGCNHGATLTGPGL